MVDLQTYFQKREEGERRLWTTPTDVALNQQLEQFVRETAQNSADESKDGKTPELIYRFSQLEGSELDDFLDAVNWDDCLQGHLEAVAEDDDEIGVQKMINRVDRGTLPLLMVEDRYTTGLIGDEFSEGTHYSSLVQDFGRSTKDEDQGGVHGVGASVLWGFSGFKTALFFTTPTGWSDDEIPRFVGRIDLPFHEYDGQEWHGDGWIGESGTGGRRATSIRGEDAEDVLADDLHIDEGKTRSDETGTTAVVVGFREPSRGRRSPSEVINRISTLISRYYWPLLLEDGLDVSVQDPSDSSPRQVDPTSEEELVPFVDAYESRNTSNDSLGEAPDIAAVNVPIEVPPKEGETDSTEGEVTLVVRIYNGEHDSQKNKVAMFRGARHVVKYRQYGHVARAVGQEFHALLLAGRARHPFDADDDDIPEKDKTVEDFFRKAEPRAHDTWEAELGKLQNNYPDGHEEIERLFKDKIPNALTELLTDAGSDEDEMLENVGRQFPYFSGGPSRGSKGGSGGGGSRTIKRAPTELSHIKGKYTGKGTLELSDPPGEEWKFNVGIEVVDSNHRPIETVPVADIEGTLNGSSTKLNKDTSGEPSLKVPAGEDTIRFKVTSESTDDINAVGEGQARLTYRINVGGSSS